MTKEKFIELEGVVVDILPDSNFRVEVENMKTVLAHKSGKIKRYNIRIILGDRVKVQVSPYDLTRGRIVYRC